MVPGAVGGAQPLPTPTAWSGWKRLVNSQFQYGVVGSGIKISPEGFVSTKWGAESNQEVRGGDDPWVETPH